MKRVPRPKLPPNPDAESSNAGGVSRTGDRGQRADSGRNEHQEPTLGGGSNNSADGGNNNGRASVPLPNIREWQSEAPQRRKEAAAARQPRRSRAGSDASSDTGKLLPSLKPGIGAS